MGPFGPSSSSFQWRWSCPSYGHRTSAIGWADRWRICMTGGGQEVEPKPIFHRARQAEIKTGRARSPDGNPQAARQIPNDYEGISLLAAVQAEESEGFAECGNHAEPFLRFGRKRRPGRLPPRSPRSPTGISSWRRMPIPREPRWKKFIAQISRHRPGSGGGANVSRNLGGDGKNHAWPRRNRQPMAMPAGVKSNRGWRDSMRGF